MKSVKKSVSAAAMLALALAIARLASPIAGLHRMGAAATPFLAGPVTSVTSTTSAPADDGSGDDDDGDEDGGDGSSGY
jgi:hypothetical protein